MIVFDDKAKKVLSPAQQELKPLLEEFMETHFLVGGTAIALHLGHRTSSDFDLFSLKEQGSGRVIAKRITGIGFSLEAGSDLRYLSDEDEPEATLFIRGVKVQLINFNRNPFGVDVQIPHEEYLCEGIRTPTLLDLAALKAFAMMYRSKWKDAVDLYYLMKTCSFDMKQIIERTKEMFTSLYSELATLETLMKAEWDRTEQIEYLIADHPKDEDIEMFLMKDAKEFLDELKK